LQTSVVDQYIQGAVLAYGFIDSGIDLVFFCYIALYAVAIHSFALPFFNNCFQFFGVKIRKHYLVALLQECFSNLLPDTAGRPAYKNYFTHS
jgi:hypothetical protein